MSSGGPGSIPLLSPDPARVRRAKARAASLFPGGAGSSHTLAPQPRAAVFGGLNQAGMSAAESGGATTPPDTTGAIGPNNYVEFVNGTGVTAYDRNLNPLSGPVSLEDFIGFPGDEVFDPQIQWDDNWGRWVYAMDDVEDPSDNFIAFGWSKSADPTDLSTEPGGGWCGYFLYTEEELNDYPKLGHSDSAITLGTNVFDTSFSFLGSGIWSISKPANPAACPEFEASGESPNLNAKLFGPLITEDGDEAFTPVPANTADSSPNSYVVAADFLEAPPEHQIMGWHVIGAGEGATLVPDGNMNVGSYEIPVNVPQPGTSEVIDSMDTRLTNAVAVTDPDAGQEAVWTQHTVDGPGGRSAVRWYELLPGTRTVRQEGTISDPSQFVFNGAISPAKQGDSAAVDFNRGSSSLFPDMHAESRDRDTPLGAMEGDVLLGTSAGHAVDFSCDIGEGEACRWGDYAGASPDPSAAGVVWGSNQGLAAPSGVSARWTTQNFALLSDLRAPAAPTIVATDPVSPANDNNPKVKGSAETRSTVRVYESANCSGPVAAEGSAATFGSPGLDVAVADNVTVQLTATATDAAGNTSACSASVAYTESTPPPPSTKKHGHAVAAKLALVRGGKAFLELSCRGAGACQGNLQLVVRVKVRKGKHAKSSRKVVIRNLVIGRAGFAIPAGKSRLTAVPLTGKGKALVRKAGRHGLKVKLQGSGVSNGTVRLRGAAKHRKRRHHRAGG